MTPEERFIRIENSLGAMAEGQAEHEQRHLQFDEDIERIRGTLEIVVGVVGKLAEAQERTDLKIDKLADTVARIAEAQGQTDFKLNALIDTVDRIVRGPSA